MWLQFKLDNRISRYISEINEDIAKEICEGCDNKLECLLSDYLFNGKPIAVNRESLRKHLGKTSVLSYHTNNKETIDMHVTLLREICAEQKEREHKE